MADVTLREFAEIITEKMKPNVLNLDKFVTGLVQQYRKDTTLIEQDKKLFKIEVAVSMGTEESIAEGLVQRVINTKEVSERKTMGPSDSYWEGTVRAIVQATLKAMNEV